MHKILHLLNNDSESFLEGLALAIYYNLGNGLLFNEFTNPVRVAEFGTTTSWCYEAESPTVSIDWLT